MDKSCDQIGEKYLEQNDLFKEVSGMHYEVLLKEIPHSHLQAST